MNDDMSVSPEPAAPGWRLLISNAGRFWAFRQAPFPRSALEAGAEPAVDADTLDKVRAEIDRQEEKARKAAAAVTS